MGKKVTNKYGLPMAEFMDLMNLTKQIGVKFLDIDHQRIEIAKERYELGTMLITLRDKIQDLRSKGYLKVPALGKYVKDELNIAETLTSSYIANATLMKKLLDKKVTSVVQRQTVLTSLRRISRAYGEAEVFKFYKGMKNYDKFKFLEDLDIANAIVDAGLAKVKAKIINIVQIRNVCNAIIEGRYCLTELSRKEALNLMGKCINILSK